MPLDHRTVAFMFGLFSCLLAGMLLLTSWHLKSIRGTKEYAFGDLCIGLAFSLGAYYSTYYAPLAADDKLIVPGAMLVALGQSLRINGIQAFNGKQPSLLFPSIITVLSGINTYWWVAIDTNTRIRAATLALIFCLINLLCVRALWVKTEPRVRMAYQITGGAYAFLTLIMFVRAITSLRSVIPVDNYAFYPREMLLVLILTSIAQFCASFGFMLMLNYRLAADLEHAASYDSLTGALNRRNFELIADKLCGQMAKTQQPLALIMLDLDHFKSINDRYGHPQGDQALQRVTDIVRASIRPTDYLGRYGGEEFCVLLPKTTENEAFQITEQMRKRFADTPLLTDTGEMVSCTFSAGICTSDYIGLNYLTMLKQADKALYYAKQSGRNKSVTVTELSGPSEP